MKPTHKIGECLYHWKGSLVYMLMHYGWQLVITDELFLSKLVKVLTLKKLERISRIALCFMQL